MRDFGGYDYNGAITDLEKIEYKLRKLDSSFNEISFSFDKTRKMILNGGNAFKIVPSGLAVNGMIDFSILKNTKNIQNPSEFLREENRSRIGNLINYREITSKEIVILDRLGSLLVFSYREGSVEMICHQIVCSGLDKEKIYLIKYEEEKEKKSSVQIFETFVESLRVGQRSPA